MNSHRLPEPKDNQLLFAPDYRVRFLLSWVAVVVSGVLLTVAWLNPEILHADASKAAVIALTIEILAPMVLVGAFTLLRARYLALDRHTGQILVATGFSGIQPTSWDAVGIFDVKGTMRFEYCQAELQSLCLLSYQAPGSEEWLLLLIYTDMVIAKEAAHRIRAWESELSVTEMQDQAALPTARGIKPLVD